MSQSSRRRLNWGAVASDSDKDSAKDEDDDDTSRACSVTSSTRDKNEDNEVAAMAVVANNKSKGNDNNNSDDTTDICYDERDHTRALPLQPGEQPPRTLIAPAALLGLSSSPSSALCDDSLVSTSNAAVVRLPHPRHGGPALYMCPPYKDKVDNNNEDNNKDDNKSSSAASATTRTTATAALLYELQAQTPPDGFVRSWFVDDVVLPSTHHLLLATPFDVTFLALHALAQHVASEDDNKDDDGNDSCADGARGERDGRASLQRCFLPAEQLYCTSHKHGGDDDGSSATLAYAHMHDDDDTYAYDNNNSSTAMTAAAQRRQRGEWRWCGWPAAVRVCPALVPVYAALCSHTTLSKLCDVKYATTTATDEEDEGDASRVAYYRFSRDKAAAWLASKVARVQASEALRTLLQLPPATATTSTTNTSTCTTSTSTSDKDSHGAALCEAEATSVVPLRMAYEVVAEYVPTTLHSAMACACGLPDSEVTTIATTMTATEAARIGDVSHLSLQRASSSSSAMAASSGARRPMSASVRRLEKAGPPKGVPTLQSLFAKKAAAKKP